MHFTMIQQDIDRGVRSSPHCCPVAHTIERETGAQYVAVYSATIWVGNAPYQAPAAVAEFVDAFDDGLKVKPIVFELGEGTMSTRTVTIPAKDQHEGIYSATVTLNWTCPACGGPRGEPRPAVSYDGSRRLHCDGWSNPCGHVDKYADVRQEARTRV